MKLKDNLYQILSLPDEVSGEYIINLIPSSIIFKAHFPGNPILPGVCIIEIARELTETAVKTSLQLESVFNAKFVSVISPMEVTRLIYNFKKVEFLEERNLIKVSIDVKDEEDKIYSKLSLIFKA